MLVGEAPGERESQNGRPFIGAAGRVLDMCLREVGIDRSDVYITNTVKCRPPQNRHPTSAECDACAIYLTEELIRIQPKIVVALGGVAGKALANKEKVGDSRGRQHPLLPKYRSPIPVLVTYHPAAYLHQRGNRSLIDNLAADLRLAQRIATGTTQAPPVWLGKDALRGMIELAKTSLLACDCEWEMLPDSGNQPWSRRNGKLPRLVSVALSGMTAPSAVTVAVPADNVHLPLIKKLLDRIPSVYHNAAADLVWLRSRNIKPRLAGDTLLLASMLNLDHSLSLEVLASILTDVPSDWKAVARSQGVVGRYPASTEEWRQLLHYNGQDAYATLLLNDRLLELTKEKQRESCLPLYERLLRAIDSLVGAALAGVPFDVDLLARLETSAQERLATTRKALADMLGVPGFASSKSGSQEQVAYAIERVAGIQLPRTPKTKKPSLTLPNLVMRQDHPAVRAYIDYSHLQKLETAYLGPWQRMLAAQGDGRMHTQYKLWVARSGRSSAEVDMGGTLQQFPRGARVRQLVRAPEGWSIVVPDYSQIELRIGAWIAAEPTMIALFRSGVDLHCATAGWLKALGQGYTLNRYLDEMHAVWIPQVTKDERQAAKGVNFGFLYGMREAKFITTARKDYGVIFSMEQAKVARDGYFRLYSRLAEWHQESWRWVNLGYVDTPFGRRRPLVLTPGEDREGLLRKAVNTPVQSMASDIALIAMGEIDNEIARRGMSDLAQIIGFVHDSILTLVRNDVLDEVQTLMRTIMEHPPLLGVAMDIPLEVEFKIGQTWA